MFLGFGAQDLRVRVLGFQGLGLRVGVRVCESLTEGISGLEFREPYKPQALSTAHTEP